MTIGHSLVHLRAKYKKAWSHMAIVHSLHFRTEYKKLLRVTLPGFVFSGSGLAEPISYQCRTCGLAETNFPTSVPEVGPGLLGKEWSKVVEGEEVSI